MANTPMSKITSLSRTTIIISIVAISLALFAIYKTAQYVTKKPQCNLTIEQAPNINGIKLGMTREELEELLPDVSLPSSEDFSINGNLSSKLTGIEKINLRIKNNRVYSFTVDYKNKGWGNLNEFIDEMLLKMDLPYAQTEPSEFEKDSIKFSAIRCKDFTIYIGGADFGGGLKRSFTVSLTNFGAMFESRK